jgi:ribulose 1,5-bisphosphate synthetase/thiazole synthase
VTYEGPTAPPSPAPGNGAADPGADVLHLIARRDLVVPEEDRAAVVEYWTHIRQLRAAVDEQLLADNEIAVTWSAAAGAPRAH